MLGYFRVEIICQEHAMEFDDFNLANPEHLTERDPLPYYAYLRRYEPIKKILDSDGNPYWAVMKHEDVMTIYRDPRLYSSECQPIITGNVQMGTEGKRQQMIQTDPPLHLQMRALVKWEFTPRATAELEQDVRRTMKDLLAAAMRKRECDFVEEIAAILPMQIFCRMLGVPDSDWMRMKHLVEMALLASDPDFRAQNGKADTRQSHSSSDNQLVTYFVEMIERRRHQPTRDLTSLLACGKLDNEPLPMAMAVRNSIMLLMAGLETTRNGISGGLHLLMNQPAELQRLRENPNLMKTAIEEIIRYVSPVAHNLRLVTQDTELRGHPLKEGDLVANWLASCNRDEDVFPDPDRFDIARDPNPHIGFGYGEHFCLGANLARLEIRIALQELMDHIPAIELTGPIQKVRNCCLPGIKHMPIRFNGQGHPVRA
jgi:cytochrome P450